MKKTLFWGICMTLLSGFMCACQNQEPNNPNQTPNNNPEANPPMVGSGTNYRLVDLGLSVLWADRNLGAASPQEYGDYYAWGEIEAKTCYDNSHYKWASGPYYNKYNTDSEFGRIDNLTILEYGDDAAYRQTEKLRMPTEAEFKELIDQCQWTWTTLNNVHGYQVVGPNGNEIFLPACGWKSSCDNYTIDPQGIGYYWTRELDKSFPCASICLEFKSNFARISVNGRMFGQSIRGVAKYY